MDYQNTDVQSPGGRLLQFKHFAFIIYSYKQYSQGKSTSLKPNGIIFVISDLILSNKDNVT